VIFFVEQHSLFQNLLTFFENIFFYIKSNQNKTFFKIILSLYIFVFLIELQYKVLNSISEAEYFLEYIDTLKSK